jgi:hypothetical protein
MPLAIRPSVGVLLASFLAGCEGEPLAVGSLSFRLDVQPAQVTPADTFTVRLVVLNAGGRDTTLVSGCSVPTFFGLNGPSGVVYPAPGSGCFTAITPFRIAAGDSLTMTRRFVAHDISQPGQPALPPGEYVLFTDWQIRGLPVLQQPLTVQ